ncbi:MAG: hypothetical protein ABI443_04970 [Chthoniobacterales bacterium]
MPYGNPDFSIKKLKPKDLASIAALLLRDSRNSENATSSDAIGRATLDALRLCEAADFAIAGYTSINPEQGIDTWKQREATWREHAQNLAKTRYHYQKDANGARLSVDLNEGLKILMPNDRKARRVELFKKWLIAHFGENRPEAQKEFTAIQKNGISPNLFEAARLTFKKWRADSTSAVRAINKKRKFLKK